MSDENPNPMIDESAANTAPSTPPAASASVETPKSEIAQGVSDVEKGAVEVFDGAKANVKTEAKKLELSAEDKLEHLRLGIVHLAARLLPAAEMAALKEIMPTVFK